MSDTAILVVSFGTSFDDTRKKTIDAIEADIAGAFPDAKVYRAWTSKMIMKKIEKRDGIHINNVTEAFEQMAADGIKEVIVQPTHVINGHENDGMIADAKAFEGKFNRIVFGTPLLTAHEDSVFVVDAVKKDFSFVNDDDALVLMGHGTTHYANSIYAALDYTFKDMDNKNFFLATVESYPSVLSMIKMLKEFQPKKVYLAPFMIVAGDHANNDMASDEPDSWKSQLEREGFDVECIMKGLGESERIRSLFIRHVQDAMKKKN